MDLQKEREVLQQLINEMGDVTNTWSVDQMVTHVWKQAKTQAVPEGYVLVPKEPTKDTLIEIASVCIGDDFANLDEAKELYKAAIKAQEPAND